MKNHIVSSEKGNALVMVIVASAIVSLMSLTIADQMKVSSKSARVGTNRGDFELMKEELNATVKNTTFCAGFAKDINGGVINIPAQRSEVSLGQLFQGTQKLLQVGQTVSSGAVVADIRLVPVPLITDRDQDRPNVTATIGGVANTYDSRSMLLRVSYQGEIGSNGQRFAYKDRDIRVRVFYAPGGGALATCQKENELRPGEFSIADATGKVDWRRSTTWAAGKGDAKYLGLSIWTCQSTTGTGTCTQLSNAGNSQKGIVVKCADGRAGFTIMRESNRNGNNIDEDYTTYCAIDTSKITVNAPAPPAPAVGGSPENYYDGDIIAMCQSKPSDPKCGPILQHYNASLACNNYLPGNQTGYDACIAAIPPYQVAQVTPTTTTMPNGNSGAGGGNNSGGGFMNISDSTKTLLSQ